MRLLAAITLCLFFASNRLSGQQNSEVFTVKKKYIDDLDSLLKLWIVPGEDTLSAVDTYSFTITDEMKQYFDKVNCTGCGLGTENRRVFFTSTGAMRSPEPVVLKFYKYRENDSVLVGRRFFFVYQAF